MIFDTAARIALSPLLIAQALNVRRAAQSLPEAQGARSGTQGQGPPLRLRIIGDSSAAGVGADLQSNALAGQLAGALSTEFTVSWALDALTGATTQSTLSRLSAAPPEPTDVIVVALGVNDITRLVPRGLWLRQQQQLFDRMRTLYAPRHIYLSGIPPLEHFPLLPNPLRWTLARHGAALEIKLRNHAAEVSDLNYIPFQVAPSAELVAEDGFHPSPALYQIWGKEMASRIISDWPK